MRSLLQGRLRWKKRYPLGSSGGVEHCTLLEAMPVVPAVPGGSDENKPWLTHIASILGGKWKSGTTVMSGHGTLKIVTLDDPDPERYTWPDPTTAASFRTTAREGSWALVWERGGTTQPLALLSPADS